MNKNKIIAPALGLLGCLLTSIAIAKPIVENSASAAGYNEVKFIKINDDEFTGSVCVASLGHGIDTVKGDSQYYDPETNKVFAKILTSQYLQSLFEDGEFYGTNLGNDSISEYGTSVKDVAERSCFSEENTGSIAASYGPYSAGLEASFSMSDDTSYKTTVSSAYYYGKYIAHKGVWGFTSGYDYDSYRNNLEPGYAADVTNAFNGKLSWSKFFEKYGTHLSVSCEFGASYEFTYKCYSNAYSFSSIKKSDIEAKIEASGMIYGVQAEGKDQNKFKMEDYLNLSNTDFTEIIRFKSHGGSSVNAKSFEIAENQLIKWSEAVDNNQNLTINRFIDKIPLWDILPWKFVNEDEGGENKSQVNYAKIMSDQYDKYKNDYEKSLSKYDTDADEISEVGLNSAFLSNDSYLVGKKKEDNTWTSIVRGIGWALGIPGLGQMIGVIGDGVCAIKDLNTGITSQYITLSYDNTRFVKDSTGNLKEADSEKSAANKNPLADVKLLKEKGFTRAQVSISFSAQENVNGTGYVKLYKKKNVIDTNSVVSPNYLVASRTFSPDGNSLMKNEGTITIPYMELSIAELIEYEQLIIQFTTDDRKFDCSIRDVKIGIKYLKPIKATC